MFSILLIMLLFTNTLGLFGHGPTMSEIRMNIKYKLNPRDMRVIKKLNGFYGTIGPNVNITTVSSLYDLFTCDGNINGIFFDNGELTYVNHFINTEKLIFEKAYGKLPQNLLMRAILMIFNKIPGFPNVLGVSNTAIIKIKNQIFALFEQDQPYMLDINFDKKRVSTVKKQRMEQIEHFSAHSKYDDINNIVHTVDYNVMDNSISYYKTDDKFNIIKKRSMKTKYVPLAHDLVVLKDGILITDSPLIFHSNKIFGNSVPVEFHNDKPTFFHIMDDKTDTTKTFVCPDSFYIFHYASHKETEDEIEICASIYENLDFSKLDICGKYRKIIINKNSGMVSIIKNPELEKYNLDFPVKHGDYVVLRKLTNHRIDGFVICEGLTVKKRICLEDKSACGEPVITKIDNTPYLITFAYNNSQGFILIIDLITNYKMEIPIPHKVNIGFHSIYIEKTGGGF